MSVSHCIGRVGGLAVALGIGAALNCGLGVALADAGAPADTAQTSTEQQSRGNRPVRAPRVASSDASASASPAASNNRRPAGTGTAVAAKSPVSLPKPAAAIVRPTLPQVRLAASQPTAAVAAPSASAPPAPAAVAPMPAAAVPAQVRQADPGTVESVPGPLSGTDPGGPVQSPVSWSVLAVARRQFGQARAALPPAVALPAATAVVNSPPTVSKVVLSTPNASTGTVTGTVAASDPNGDKITYKATSTKGTVSITTTGIFTYTPTATARHAAAKVGATTSATTDTVTVTVTDSKGASTSTPVTVPITPKNAVPVATKTVGVPNASTGVVTGVVKATDTDKDVLVYSGPGTTAKGTVTVTTTTGAFTYTPTAAARHAAAKIGAPAADKADAFTVTVTDGYGGVVAVPISVVVSPKNSAPVAGTPTVGTPDATTGVVAGTATANDADLDTLSYSAPTTTAKGNLTLDAATGSFTYTPTVAARYTAAGATATTADKTDTFTVTATDGYGGTTTIPVSVAISPKAAAPSPTNLTFVFNYGTGSQYWTAAARTALETAAAKVASYINAPAPVTIVYSVTGVSNTTRTLATATSDFASATAGFQNLVVQNKILTGVDANGAGADGAITVNFGMPWSFTNTVSSSQYDFVSTTMHEIVHSMGFITMMIQPGYNTGTLWTKYDSFIMTSGKVPVVGNTFKFNTAYNSYLTGTGGGLFFGGPNAIAAYGGPVPLYTPSTWAAGSSINHLRDSSFTGASVKLMNAMVSTGLRTRALSEVELAILKDIGYQIVPVQAGATLTFVAVLFLRRRRRQEAVPPR